jgi:hypothetical protein
MEGKILGAQPYFRRFGLKGVMGLEGERFKEKD